MLALQRYETMCRLSKMTAVPKPTSVTLDLSSFFVPVPSEVGDFGPGPKGPMHISNATTSEEQGTTMPPPPPKNRHIMCRYASITTTSVSNTAWKAAPQSPSSHGWAYLKSKCNGERGGLVEGGARARKFPVVLSRRQTGGSTTSIFLATFWTGFRVKRTGCRSLSSGKNTLQLFLLGLLAVSINIYHLFNLVIHSQFWASSARTFKETFPQNGHRTDEQRSVSTILKECLVK